MWELRHLTTLWAFTACYRDSLTFIMKLTELSVFIYCLFDDDFSSADYLA
jgi:hypothetical protein